jgi:RNA polymerase sigma-70 factor (ECF subfamily)
MTNQDQLSRAEDLEIVRGIRRGEPRSVEILVQKYVPRLKGFLRYLNAPESMIEDVIQESFLRALAKLDLFVPPGAFSSWFFRIARNILIDEIRKDKSRQARENSVDSPMSTPAPEDTVISGQYIATLLDRLPPAEKALFDLRVLQGISFVEIAEMTGEPEGTLRSRFFRTLKRLRIGTEDPQN